MKERLVTFACALGALALFAAMFLRGEGHLTPEGEVPRPTTAERRSNGHYAVFEWLRGERLRALAWRERFDALAESERLASPTGNLLVLTLPVSASFQGEEFIALARWIRTGNTLLVLAALSDRPEWAQGPPGLVAADLNLLTGLEFERVSPSDAPALRTYAQPRRETLVPNRAHAYFEGVQSAVASTDAPASAWRVNVPYDGFVLALARDGRTGAEALWTRPLGKGAIIVSSFGSLFTNRAIGQGDNARLLANILATNVSPQGAIVFDDLHQGLGGAYDPRQFYADPRLYVSVTILAALWLVWVLGATPLRTPVTRAPAPREAALVEAGGEFFARVLPRAAAARGLIEHFLARTRRRASLAASEPPWSWLERQPRVESADVVRLQRWYAAACDSRRVPLGRVQNLLVRLERQLA